MSGMEEGSGQGAAHESSLDDQQFTEQLTRLIRVGNQLASAPDVDALCRQAVEKGLHDLGFERMSIWLVDSDRKLIRGTFGTDESGLIRDERAQYHSWSERMQELELLSMPQILFKRSRASLFNEANEVVGTGEVGAAALWNGEEVIGLLYMDNLLTKQSIHDNQWRLFELYASTLGHLLSLKRTESALRSNEELLGQILEILPVGVFVIAKEGGITRYNSVSHEIWEFKPESIRQWMPKAVWVDNRRAVRKEEWAGERALALGISTLNQEVEIVRRDGRRRVLLNSGVPLRNLSGELNGAVVVNQDMTESKRREQQLEAMARLGQALRPLMGCRGVVDTVVNQLVQLLHAQGVAIVLGNGARQVVLEAAAGIFAPLAGEVSYETFAELLNAEENLSQTPFGFNAEHVAIRRLYEKLANPPLITVIAPLVAQSSALGFVIAALDDAPDDAMLSLAGALADVSAAAIQRGQLYDEVTMQAYQLDRVMESVNFGLVLLDPQRRVVLVNQHAQVKLSPIGQLRVGEELLELGGQTLGRFLTPLSSHSSTREINTEGVIYEITTVPVGATAAEGGWLMVIHDVTRERAVQANLQQQQRLAAVGQLAAGMAHDFNNIIAVISIYVQMLRRNPALDEADNGRLDIIHEQAQHASRLIRQILDFSRQSVIERQPVDLRKLVQDCVALWVRTQPANIAYRLVLEIEEPAQIYAEASSIQQALTNLGVNPRDAMPNGGELTLRLRTMTVGEGETPPVTGLKTGTWYEVQVMDNGDGIDPENLSHIFDPFFTTKDVGKGSGLGLAQVYGIVQQHGGLVTVQSETGKGTSISLFLPALGENRSTPASVQPSELAGEGTETILLVEDNRPAREATTALLEMMGYRVFAAGDGREGFALFQQHSESIQLLLSAQTLPEMDGMELFRQIHKEKGTVCLITMTRDPLAKESTAPAEQSLVDWLQKPFTVKQLTAAVRTLLNRAKSLTIAQDEDHVPSV